ncbi:prephenate dehydratase domain-containing protein [Pontibacter sp. BT731]|uniref:prephenate dehydratase n=1 Tax=Pontibacter coccineus TaxID=3063328 RepID=UPI0026E3DD9D|nr:prephenate dehydratase domain-containing protein [Pontibacter sp. BT731]MDO6390133.1 prephenate dehydratase domain-containing protein [Pontibacter sp. BT731]
MKIAIQGIAGAFHEEAARLRFGDRPMEIVPCLTFRELAAAVATGLADKGIMAIENTISGTMQPNLELIREHQLWISGEVIMRIRQHLGGVPGSSLQSIRTVHSHYMALNQCRPFFEAYPDVELIESEDTALSIRDVARAGSKERAAIGSALAIAQNGLIVLGEGIEASKQNYTRFLLLDRQPQQVAACNKATLSLVLPPHPEAFTQAMSLLQERHIQVSKIESVVIPDRPWHYRYYLDLRFEAEEQLHELQAALHTLAESVDLLGKYTAYTL